MISKIDVGESYADIYVTEIVKESRLRLIALENTDRTKNTWKLACNSSTFLDWQELETISKKLKELNHE